MKVNHINIFSSYLARDCFILDILEKIAEDWKNSHKAKSFSRDNFEEFILEEFPEWLECGVEDFLNEEFEEDN